MRILTSFLCASLWLTPVAADATRPPARVVVATGFAVPVGVPVAPFAPTYYQLQPPNGAAPAATPAVASSGAVDEEALADRVAARVYAKLAGEADAPPPPAAAAERLSAQAVMARSCASCHAGASPLGAVALDGPPGELDRATRQEVILRVLSTDPARRMPQHGPPLSEPEFLALFRELFH